MNPFSLRLHYREYISSEVEPLSFRDFCYIYLYYEYKDSQI